MSVSLSYAIVPVVLYKKITLFYNKFYEILGMFKPIGNQYVGQVIIRYFTVSYSDIMQVIRYLKAYRMDLCKQCQTANHQRISKPHPQAICNTLLRSALECYIPFTTFCYITCLKWHLNYLGYHCFKLSATVQYIKNRHTFNSNGCAYVIAVYWN